MRLYLTIAAVLSWFALALQLALVIASASPGGAPVAAAIVGYFSFFTILTNLIVALVLTCARWSPSSKWGSFFSSPTVQTAALIYIAVVGVTYSFLLRDLWSPEGAQKLADHLLHDAMPVIYVIYWLLFVPKNKLRWKDPVMWLIFPAIYLLLMLTRGAVTGVYPYHFLDVARLGYARMLVNAALFLLIFLGAGFSAVAIGRWTARREQTA